MSKAKGNSGMVFVGLGFELVGLCVGGWFLAEPIDTYMGWKNTAQTYLVLILLVGWFIHLFYLLQKFERDNADYDPPKS